MNLKHLEKTAGPVGVTLAGTAGFIKNHPFATLGILSAVPISSFILNSANKARGLHQIVTESSKAKRMDYQTQLLKEISQNSRRQEAPANFKPLVPIIPPLR